jgi:hypothetical protein
MGKDTWFIFQYCESELRTIAANPHHHRFNFRHGYFQNAAESRLLKSLLNFVTLSYCQASEIEL